MEASSRPDKALDYEIRIVELMFRLFSSLNPNEGTFYHYNSIGILCFCS